MSDVAKPDPAAEQVANPGATLVKDETAKVTTDKAADKEEKPGVTSNDDKPVTEKATEAATSAAAAVKDNVFSMFGGGPKKEKKEEADDANEPSGSSKAQAGGVCGSQCGCDGIGLIRCRRKRTRRTRSLTSSLPQSFTSPRRSTPRPTRSSRSRSSRCAPSESCSFPLRQTTGRGSRVAPATCSNRTSTSAHNAPEVAHTLQTTTS